MGPRHRRPIWAGVLAFVAMAGVAAAQPQSTQTQSLQTQSLQTQSLQTQSLQTQSLQTQSLQTQSLTPREPPIYSAFQAPPPREEASRPVTSPPATSLPGEPLPATLPVPPPVDATTPLTRMTAAETRQAGLSLHDGPLRLTLPPPAPERTDRPADLLRLGSLPPLAANSEAAPPVEVERLPATTQVPLDRRAPAPVPPATQLGPAPGASNGGYEPTCLPAYDSSAFSPDPDYSCAPYDAHYEKSPYEGKWWNPNQRPLIELGRGLYRPGPIPPSSAILGPTNLLKPSFLLFGDYRTAVAWNDNGGDDQEQAVFAHRANLDFDWQITATERIHAFWGPLDEDGRFSRATYTNADRNLRLFEEFDDDFDTLFFEGDLGYLYGGMTGQMAPFDLPFVVGKYPLLFQNGVWFFDAVEGFAFTIPARNSPLLDWSNSDFTFFCVLDDIDSLAFDNDDAQAFGFNWFLEAYDGYFEIGYAYLNDTTDQGLSYHNATFSYTRRYFQRVSNSIRVIVNGGQDPVNGADTADGTAILLENALISHKPLVFVPYLNLFAGFGRPQQVAGRTLLINTGINFESDGLTGFPLLDPTANDTYGGALGINWLGCDFSWQLLLELATVQTFGNDPNRNAIGDQYALGMRYQIPLTNAWLARFDSMVGIREGEDDIRGVRMELRWKF